MATAVDTLRRSTINLGAISESLESSRRSVSSARNSIDNISNVISCRPHPIVMLSLKYIQ